MRTVGLIFDEKPKGDAKKDEKKETEKPKGK